MFNPALVNRSIRIVQCIESDASILCLHPKAQSLELNSCLSLIVLQAMKNDISFSRMMAFVKRLLQAGATALPGAAAGFVLLLSELMKVTVTIGLYSRNHAVVSTG